MLFISPVLCSQSCFIRNFQNVSVGNVLQFASTEYICEWCLLHSLWFLELIKDGEKLFPHLIISVHKRNESKTQQTFWDKQQWGLPSVVYRTELSSPNIINFTLVFQKLNNCIYFFLNSFWFALLPNRCGRILKQHTELIYIHVVAGSINIYS